MRTIAYPQRSLDLTEAAREIAGSLPPDLKRFFVGADDAIRSQSADRITDAVREFQSLAFSEDGGNAAEWWDKLTLAARTVSEQRRKTGQLQSVWGVTPIVSLRYGAEADRRLGLSSESLVFETYYITRDFGIDLSAAQTRVLEEDRILFRAFRRLVLAWALLSYDVFHLYNDRGFVDPAGGYGSDRFGIALLELELYRKAGKALFTYAYGADHRMRQKSLATAPLNFCIECPEPGKFCVCDDEGGMQMLTTISQYATRMVGYGLSMDLLPNARWLNYLVVDPEEIEPPELAPSGDVLRVGHFPNHGFFKGTHYLERAIEDLKSAGRPIELVQFSGLPREQILDAMKSVDVVVDQLISGSFGLTALEAMALGRPVVAHLRPGVQVAALEACPIISANPATIHQVLDLMVDNRAGLADVGRRGVAYVTQHCSVDAMAVSLAGLYRDHLELQKNPRDWLTFWSETIERRLVDRGVASGWIHRGRLRRLGRKVQRRWEGLIGKAHTAGLSVGPFLWVDTATRRTWKILARARRSGTEVSRRIVDAVRRVRPSEIIKRVKPFVVKRVKPFIARLIKPFEVANLAELPPVASLAKLLGRIRGRLNRMRVKTVAMVLAQPDGWPARIEAAAERWLERSVERARRSTERRLRSGNVRTLWGITPILTLPLKARADRSLGFESKSLVYYTYVIAKSFDINLERYWRHIAHKHPKYFRTFHKLVLGWMMTRYDVFHYFFDRGILPSAQRFGIDPRELDILRRAGKRVYVYAYGADVRMRQKTLDLGRWNFCVDCPEAGRFCFCDDTVATRTIAQITERSTAVVALGDMIHYAPGCRHMHYWPIDTARLTPIPAPPSNRTLRIAHAPNHTHFKGSHYLEQTIEKLRGEGHEIEYIKVQGVPNEQVIKLFGEADVVADQFIGGAYGYTALEAMARAKPVLTYVRTVDLVEAPEDCPLINTTPVELEGVLRWLLANREQLPLIGAQGRAYVEKWHSIEAVGARFGQMYIDTADFPRRVTDRIRAAIREESNRRESIKNAVGWEHPFMVGRPIGNVEAA